MGSPPTAEDVTASAPARARDGRVVIEARGLD
jgi:hypothetical protein